MCQHAWALVVYSFVLTTTPSLARADRTGFEARVSTVPGHLLSVSHGDLDGDGLEDLVATYKRGASGQVDRYVAVFFRRASGLPPKPDLAFEALDAAVVYDVGEVDGRPGDEIVYLTDTGVWAHGFPDREAHPVRRLVATASLFAEPQRDALSHWDYVRKIDGKVLVMVPGTRDIRMFRVGKAGLEPACRIRIDRRSTYSGAFSGASGMGGAPFGLRVTTTLPTIDFIDATGDGRADLVSHFEDFLSIYPGGEDGCFDLRPSHRQAMNARTPEELSSGNMSAMATPVDLDGDDVADLVVTKIGGGLTDLHTEIRLHRSAKGGGFEKEPSQVFELSGFSAFSVFEDVDGDGAIEMVQPKAEISIMALTQVLLSSTFSIDVLVRRAVKGRSFFSEEPVQTLSTEMGIDFSRPNGLLGAIPQFGHDFDGDGRLDVLMSKGKDEMGLYRGVAGEEPFESDDKLGFDGPGSIATRVVDPGKGRAPEVVVWYPGRPGMKGTIRSYRPVKSTEK